MRQHSSPKACSGTTAPPHGADLQLQIQLPPGWSTYVPTEAERREWRAFWRRLLSEPGPETTEAPEELPPGASSRHDQEQPNTGTVTRGATTNQGNTHDTTTCP